MTKLEQAIEILRTTKQDAFGVLTFDGIATASVIAAWDEQKAELQVRPSSNVVVNGIAREGGFGQENYGPAATKEAGK